MKIQISQKDTFEAIQNAPQKVCLITGPVNCSKTQAVLDFYTSCASQKTGSALIVTPNSPTQKYILRKLTREQKSGVVLSPMVTTFTNLSARLLSATGTTATAISNYQRHVLIREIVDTLAEAGQFTVLDKIAQTPGLISTLSKSIAELKREAVAPEFLANAINTTAGKTWDLLLVYKQYQKLLSQRNQFDIDGQSWVIRDHLQNSLPIDLEKVKLENLQTLIFDGFTDFNPTQLSIIKALAGSLEKVIITLPYQEDSRPKNWLWTKRTRRALESNFRDDMLEIQLSAQPAKLREIDESVFTYETKKDLPKDFNLIAAAGTNSEILAIAQRVKALLTNPKTAKDSIAILVRTPDNYAQNVARIFAKANIPIAKPAMPILEIPIIKFVLSLLELSKTDFNFATTLRIIRNSYFNPATLGDFSKELPIVAESFIREENVFSGRSTYANACLRIINRIDRSAEDESKSAAKFKFTAEQYTSAFQMLEKLFQLCEEIFTSEDLLKIIETINLKEASRVSKNPETIARDLRAIQKLTAILQADPNCKISTITEALTTVSIPPARSESLVDFISVIDAKNIRYDHVFLVGASEGQFPTSFSESSLIGETQRANWLREGLILDSKDELYAREMLLFYLAISRADKSLTISYQRSDSSGKASAPGIFLRGLIENFGGEDSPEISTITELQSPGHFFFDESKTVTNQQALAGAAAVLFGQSDKTNFRKSATYLQNSPQALKRFSQAIWVNHNRWLPGIHTNFEGRLHDSSNISRQKSETSNHVFSANQLSTFGKCPWQYFAKNILNLKSITSPDRQLQAISKGIFCHNVLQAVFSKLAEQHGRPFKLSEIPWDSILDLISQCIEREDKLNYASKMQIPKLWEIQKKQLADMITSYLKSQYEQNIFEFEPFCFELAFGIATAENEAVDSASITAPITISTPSGDLKIKGKIDRIDIVHTESTTETLIVDYKTSANLPATQASISGVNTQMPLYTKAAEILLNKPCAGGSFHSLSSAKTRNFASFNISRGKLKEDEKFDQNLTQAISKIGEFVTKISEGKFDLRPQDSKICSYCDFRQACSYSPTRAEIKEQSNE